MYGSNVRELLPQLGHAREERSWPWKRLWMKLLLYLMWEARLSAATSSSERPAESYGGVGGPWAMNGKEGGKMYSTCTHVHAIQI